MNGKDASPAPGATSEKGHRRQSWYARLLHWIDRRTGVEAVLRESLDEPIPGGARLAYVFGSALLFILASQVITGICLALYYAPSPMTAHVSVAYIVKQVAGGAFLRSLHSYGSSTMVVVLLLHLLQTLLYGSYKGKRELLWMSGGMLSLLVLGMAFTGYLLSWDQNAFYAGSVGTDIVGQVPVIGERLRLLLRGGATMGALTLSRFYVLHILIIPALIFGLIAIHLVMFRKAGAAGPVNEDPLKPVLPPEMFYPKQVLLDMGFVLLVMGVLGMLAHFLPVSLGREANPADGHYLPRPEWYFVPVFQWLKYWEGPRTVIGVVVIPVILVGLFFLLPFMDRGRERRPWRRPIPVGGVLIVLIGLVRLGLTSVRNDARDPAVAAQLAQQQRDEQMYFHAPFLPYTAASTAAGAATAPLDPIAALGKTSFNSHGCNGCHGEGGVGAVGPALTHIGSQYPPPQLTALLKTPTAKMRAAGMVPLALTGGEMAALVAYLGSLGGASADSGATPPGSVSSARAPVGTDSSKAAAPLQRRAAGATASASPGGGKAPAGAMPGSQTYRSQGCVSCHGAGGTGTPRAPALLAIGKRLSAVQLTSLLRAPNARMKAGGMPPVTVRGGELTSLVAYLRGLTASGSAQKRASAAAPVGKATATGPPASATPATAASPPTRPPSSATTEPGSAGSGHASADPSVRHGETLFSASGCSSCHGPGGTGTGRAPALTALGKTMGPAALTNVLRHPNGRMQAGGMPAVNLGDADMGALVAYLHNLGAAPSGTSPANASPVAAQEGSESTSPQAMSGLESKGQGIFRAHGCANCHGADGASGTAAAPALAGTGASLTTAQLNTLLLHPTARMQQGGMPPVSLNGDALKALVAYVRFISASKKTPQ